MKSFSVRSFLLVVIIAASFQGFLFSQTARPVLVPYKNDAFNLYGFKDSVTGKVMVIPRYNYADKFVDGLSRVTVDGMYGFVDRTGKLVLPCKYDFVFEPSDGMALLKTADGKYGYCNNKGIVVIPPKYTDANDFGNGLAPVKVGEKYGYINKTGQWVIAQKYNDARPFSDGLAIVTLGEKQGLIDKTGKFCIPLKEEEISWFSTGVYKLRNADRNAYGLMDKTGKWLTDSTYRYIGDLNFKIPGGIASITTFDDKTGLVNGKGEIVMQPAFDSWKEIGHQDMVCVYINYKLYVTEDTRFGLYDLRQKKLITELNFNEIDDKYSDNMLAFVQADKVGYFDSIGQVIIQPVFDMGYKFNNGAAIVKKDGKYCLINRTGTTISDSYDYIFKYSDDFFLVNNGGTWNEDDGLQGGLCGLIRFDGTVMLPPVYNEIDLIYDGMIIFLRGDTLGFMDLQGREIMKPGTSRLGAFNDGLALFSIPDMDKYDNNEEDYDLWGYVSKNGEEVVPAKYDDADDFSDSLGKVKQADAIIYLDITGKEMIRMTDFEEAGPFSDGMAWVIKDGKVGYIDKTGALKIPCIYGKGKDFSDGVTVVELLDYEILINKKGEEIRRWKK
jgi:hypothetical protein